MKVSVSTLLDRWIDPKKTCWIVNFGAEFQYPLCWIDGLTGQGSHVQDAAQAVSVSTLLDRWIDQASELLAAKTGKFQYPLCWIDGLTPDGGGTRYYQPMFQYPLCWIDGLTRLTGGITWLTPCVSVSTLLDRWIDPRLALDDMHAVGGFQYPLCWIDGLTSLFPCEQ